MRIFTLESQNLNFYTSILVLYIGMFVEKIIIEHLFSRTTLYGVSHVTALKIYTQEQRLKIEYLERVKTSHRLDVKKKRRIGETLRVRWNLSNKTEIAVKAKRDT